MLNVTITRTAVVKAARGWLGTPYHHQASLCGAGTDCLGLIRGIWRELYGPEPEAMPPYTQDWGNATGSETLIEAACRHLVRLADASEAGPGDVLVFRMRDQGVAKHAGVLTSRAEGSAAARWCRQHRRAGAQPFRLHHRSLSQPSSAKENTHEHSRLSSQRWLRQGLPHADSWRGRRAFGRDMSLTDLIAKLPAVLGGLGLAALGAKVDDTKSAGGTKPAKGK